MLRQTGSPRPRSCASSSLRPSSPTRCARFRDRVPCYLETADPANVAFYERFGFINQALVIPAGPELIVMQRPIP
jgi:hypothetical protein